MSRVFSFRVVFHLGECFSVSSRHRQDVAREFLIVRNVARKRELFGSETHVNLLETVVTN